MDNYHIAKLLQIIGILIGTGFGTILLNPEVVGRMAHSINERFLNLGNTVKERYRAFLQILMPKGSVPVIVTEAIGRTQIIFGAWAVLSVSLGINADWIFWLAVSILSIYALGVIIDTILLFFIRFPKQYPLWSFPIVLAVRIVLGLVFLPILVFIFIIINYILWLVVLLFNSIAGKGIFRRLLIIGGFLLVIFGLIFEFFIT